MGTPLQEIYDCFFSKTDDDFFDKENLIFEFFKSAIAKSNKNTNHSLDYILTDPTTYDGEFNEFLDQDEIELIASWMVYQYLDKKEKYLVGLQREIGTKDFNALPDKKRELDGIQNSMRLTKENIKDLEQQFNQYKYD